MLNLILIYYREIIFRFILHNVPAVNLSVWVSRLRVIGFTRRTQRYALRTPRE
jgi:hypothetical protein